MSEKPVFLFMIYTPEPANEAFEFVRGYGSTISEGVLMIEKEGGGGEVFAAGSWTRVSCNETGVGNSVPGD